MRTPVAPGSAVRGRRCIVCDTVVDGLLPLYERHGFTLVRCPGCGLVLQHPPPDPAVIEAAYYGDEAFAAMLMDEHRETTIARAREKVALLAPHGLLGAGRRLLDVGASSGAWLEVAKQLGVTGVGVEVGAATAAGARARGLDVRTGTLGEIAPTLAGERFDLITFWDVLEHLEDPRRELGLARALLAPGGRLAVTFPNVDGLYPRLTYRLFARRTGVWEHPELPVHLYDFSPRTARELLSRSGFTVEAVRTFATPYPFFRATSLSPEQTGWSRRKTLLRASFDAVHRVVYPLARLTDRGNAQIVLARSA